MTRDIYPEWLTKKVVKPLHTSMVLGRRFNQLSNYFTKILPNQPLVGLDVGSGSGELALSMVNNLTNLKMVGVDVFVRENTAIEVTQFDGKRLPFADKSFDFIMLSDVLHHTDDPLVILQECARVAREFILIKDHVCDSEWDRIRLSFMDWVGNRGYGVVLPYNYLSTTEWNNIYEKAGLICEKKITKLDLYPQPLSSIFDSSLHFIVKLLII